LHFETNSNSNFEWNFDIRNGDVFVRFMQGARTNVAFNCLERNVARGIGAKVAFYW
jgi:acetyl-CoA synthetase